jgi:hypothetical protein
MSIFNETLPDFVQTQLTGREKNFDAGGLTMYQENMAHTAWIRAISGVDTVDSKGDYTNDLAQSWILTGYNQYGDITSPLPGYQKSLRHGTVPIPGITSLECQSISPNGSLRKVTINFKCWSLEQLEILEKLYMRPGFTVCIEWGWNKDVGSKGNIDISPFGSSNNFLTSNGGSNLMSLYEIAYDEVKKSNGNYDICIGKVQNYNWEATTDGGYNCTTTIVTYGEVIQSFKINFIAMDSAISINGAVKSATGANSTSKYGENLLAGLLGELFDAGKVADNGAKTDVTVSNGKGDKTYTLLTLDLAEGIKTQPYLTADSIGKNVYIKFEDFCDLINRFLMLSNNKGNLITLRTKNYNGADLLCRAHPFQISANPAVCLIRPDFWLETILQVSEKDKQKAKEIQKATQDTSYGNPKSVNDGVKLALGENKSILKKVEYILQHLEYKLSFTKNENFEDLKSLIDDVSVQIENYISKIDTKKNDDGTYTITLQFSDNTQLPIIVKSLLASEVEISIFGGFAKGTDLKELQKTATYWFDHYGRNKTTTGVEFTLYQKLYNEDPDNFPNKIWELLKPRPLVQQFNIAQIEAGNLVAAYDDVSETSKDIQFGLSALKSLDPYFVTGNRYKGKIGKIYLNLDYIYKLIAPIGTEISDPKRENNKNLANILKQLLTEVQNNLGSINDFELFIDPTFNTTRIIDKNLVEGAKDVYSITVDNKKTTAKSYGIRSNIFPEQSNIIAISAQAKSGALGEKNQHLVAYNKGIQDRIIGNEINSRASITNKITNFDTEDISNPIFKALSAITDSLSIYTPLAVEVAKRINTETNPVKKRQEALELIRKIDPSWADFLGPTSTDEVIFNKLDQLY